MSTPPPYYLKSRLYDYACSGREPLKVWGTSAIFDTREEAQLALDNIRKAESAWEFAIFHQGLQLPGEEA